VFICFFVFFILHCIYSDEIEVIRMSKETSLLDDGLGLVSYCFVIYYQNSKSYNTDMLTGKTLVQTV
jgi:NADH-ubiquinone oxidoreductase chain 5